MLRWGVQVCLIAMVLAGCQTSRNKDEGPVVDPSATMEFLEPGLRPEVILFPEYLVLEDFEIERHGRVPNSEFIGAGLKTTFSLNETRTRYTDVLEARGWSVDKVEIEKHSFRMLASTAKEHIEIRGVRGSGDTSLFLLYEPDLANPPRVF